MARNAVQRLRDGRYAFRLSAEERDLLRGLPGQLRELLGSDDPSLRRLSPPAHPDDEASEAEYRELVGSELDAQRRGSLDLMEATIDEDRLDEEQITAWLTAVNDLRLVLGTRLDVTEELYEEGIPERDPRAPAFAVYLYLGWLQEQIVAALAAGLESAER